MWKKILLMLTVLSFFGCSITETEDSVNEKSLNPAPAPLAQIGNEGIIQIEAENYTYMSGIGVENCSEGGQNVGWIDYGDWLAYNVNIAEAGEYLVEYRVASLNGGGVLRIEQNGGLNVLGQISIPKTSGWQNWTTVSHKVTFSNAGAQSIGLAFPVAGYNINWIKLTKVVIPPTMIEAENYTYMSGVGLENCSEGGRNVGWIDANDWMSYNVNIVQSGEYLVEYRVASLNGGGSIRLEQNGGQIVLGQLSVPKTSGWQTWTTISHKVNFSNAGTQSVGIAVPAGGYNLNWIKFSKSTTPPPPPVPTVIEAEKFTSKSSEITVVNSQYISNFKQGGYLEYKNVDFGVGTKSIEFNMGGKNTGRSFTIRKASRTGEIIGRVTPKVTGAWNTFVKQSFAVTETSGIINLYFVGETGTGICSIDNFKLSKEPINQWTFNNLVWSDEFNGTSIDMTKWGYDLGGNGWGNSELQNYTNRSANSMIRNGNLIIKAIKENYGGNQYTSARMVTKNKGDWKYGRIEVKAKLPFGRGTWPAIWMLPTDWEYGGWPKSGEIDIMEHVGYDMNRVHVTVHTEAYNHMIGTQVSSNKIVPNVSTEYHIYSIEWHANKIDFFIDGEKCLTFLNKGLTYKEWPFDKRFHLILNIAVGGSWGGVQGVDTTIWPQEMAVDYVRVYQ